MRLGCEKRLQHPAAGSAAECRTRNRRSRFPRRLARPDGDHDPAALRRRLPRVGEQVEKHLIEIALTARDRRKLAGDVSHSSIPLGDHPVPQDRRRRFDRAPHLSVRRCAAPRLGRTPASLRKSGGRPAAPSGSLEVRRQPRRGRVRPCGDPPASAERAATSNRARCSHRERRCAPVRHRVLPLALSHPRSKRLRAMEILYRHGSLRPEVLDQLGVVWLQLSGMPRRDLQHADQRRHA